jgi:hypothetical protein
MILFDLLTDPSFADTDTDVAVPPDATITAPQVVTVPMTVPVTDPVAVAVPTETVAVAETTATAAVPTEEASMNVDLQKVFTSPDAYLTVIIVVIAVTLLKRTVVSINSALLDLPKVKMAFEWAGPIVAVILAALPGLWDQFPHPIDFLIAIPCGFFAERVYKSVLSRFLPAAWLLSSDAPSRASEQPVMDEVKKVLDKTSFQNLDQVIGHLVMSSKDGLSAEDVQQALKKLFVDESTKS